MKIAIIIIFNLFTLCVTAGEAIDLSPAELKKKVSIINDLQNKILMKGSKVSDVDELFLNFTDDFEYIHEVYGGIYTKEHLYNNYVKFLKAGEYQLTDDRYKIISTIAGHNAISVERQQIHNGEISNHLSVFEFKGSKVSKIIEYWK